LAACPLPGRLPCPLPADERCPDGLGFVVGVGVVDALELVGEPGERVGLGECVGECVGVCVGEWLGSGLCVGPDEVGVGVGEVGEVDEVVGNGSVVGAASAAGMPHASIAAAVTATAVSPARTVAHHFSLPDTLKIGESDVNLSLWSSESAAQGLDTGVVTSGSPADEFATFARLRWRALWRAAWLLTGDAYRAEDLVQSALERTWPHRTKLGTDDERTAYVYRVLTRLYARDARRRWHGELPSAQLPESTAEQGDPALRVAVLAALDDLPTRQ
jgi:hypothetical protein